MGVLCAVGRNGFAHWSLDVDSWCFCMTERANLHRIVILGAGIAGWRTALELVKRRVRLKEAEILLVDPSSIHAYWPLVYEVCSGGLLEKDPSDARVGEGVWFSFDDLLPRLKKPLVRLVRDRACSVQSDAQTVTLETGEVLSYDDLVVAIGSEAMTYNVPGVVEHAALMRTQEGIHAIRARLREELASCLRGGTRACMDVVIVGGGAIGVELAMELAHFSRALLRSGRANHDEIRIVLLEAGPGILGHISPRIRARVMRRLQTLGVDVRINMAVARVEKDAVIVRAGSSEISLPSRLTVWAAGVRPSQALRGFNLPLAKNGGIDVESTFLVRGVPRVYALGDAMTFLHPKTSEPVPATGQAAVREAGLVAENIVRALERKPLVAWVPPERWIMVVPMGGMRAIADLGFMSVGGFFGYLVRKSADLLYYAALFPLPRACAIWLKGWRVHAQND